jgi:hypothetical protein
MNRMKPKWGRPHAGPTFAFEAGSLGRSVLQRLQVDVDFRRGIARRSSRVGVAVEEVLDRG